MEKTVFALVIDKSASMYDVKQEMLESINSRIQKIIKMGNKTLDQIIFDLTMFNHNVDNLISNMQSHYVSSISESQYNLDGTTALYDAIGFTYDRLSKKYNDLIIADKCKLVIIIFTDGYENASRFYSLSKIKEILNWANSSENIELSIIGSDAEIIVKAAEMSFKSHNIVKTSKKELGNSLKHLDNYFNDIKGKNRKTFNEYFKK